MKKIKCIKDIVIVDGDDCQGFNKEDLGTFEYFLSKNGVDLAVVENPNPNSDQDLMEISLNIFDRCFIFIKDDHE